jgi:hypothetical protein
MDPLSWTDLENDKLSAPKEKTKSDGRSDMPANRVEQALRRANGARKGVSGNPSERPRIVADLQAAARALAPEAFGVLARIMVDERQSASARVAAANSILDRGFGRPTTAVIMEEPSVSPEEAQRQHEFADRLLQEWNEMLEHARSWEERALAAERQLAILGLDPAPDGENAWKRERLED